MSSFYPGFESGRQAFALAHSLENRNYPLISGRLWTGRTFWHGLCVVFLRKGRVDNMKLLRKHKLLLLIPAVLLMGIFIGMIPLNMAHRLAGGCPFVHGKQAAWNNPCPFRSVTTNDKPLVAALNPLLLDQELQLSQESPILVFSSFFYSPAFNFIPLRC